MEIDAVVVFHVVLKAGTRATPERIIPRAIGFEMSRLEGQEIDRAAGLGIDRA